MKKSKLLKLLSGAMLFIAAMGFTSCVDDNDDLGMPYLEVTPQVLKFDANGTAVGASEFVVKSNRPWTLDIPAEAQWVRPSVTQGEGDGTVSFNLFASNVAQEAELTFSLKNSAGFAYASQKVKIQQGDVVETVDIFNETFGTKAVQSPWPTVDTYDGWQTTGEGIEHVTFTGTNTSIRSSGKSSTGAYDGATGPNVLFFGAAPATFTVNNIALKADQTRLRITFGGQFYDGSSNNFPKENMILSISGDGTNFIPLDYTVNNGDQEDPYWVLATKDFTLANAVSNLWIRLESVEVSSAFRVDDLRLTTGNGGEVIDLGEVKVAVTTNQPTGVTATDATLAGSVNTVEGVTAVGFQYVANAASIDWSGVAKTPAEAIAAQFTKAVTGLTAGTTYAVRAYATTAEGDVYGSVVTFVAQATVEAYYHTSIGTKEVPQTPEVASAYDGWDATGSGASTVTYSSSEKVTIRKSGLSNIGKDGPAYNGASGPNVIFFGTAPTEFAINSITVPQNQTKMSLTFGASYSKKVGTEYVNTFDKTQFHVSLSADGTNWTPITYEVNDGDTKYPYWVFATADFTLTSGVSAIYVKFEAGESSVYRLDDITLAPSATGGQSVDLGGGAVDQPSLAPTTATMEFAAAVDATGKTQVYELKNATGLTLFADVADKTNFSAAVENGNTVRVKTLTANDGTARTTTVTAYLAQSADGEKKATATINVTQQGQSSGAVAITIPQLNALIAPATAANAVLDADNDRELVAIVMNDVAGDNYSFNNLILATEGSTDAGNGVTLYGSQVEPSTLNLNKGDKVRVTLLKGLAKVRNYNGMYEVTGDRDVEWCSVEKIASGVSIPVAAITPPQLAAYQGMAVSIDNASVAAPGVWAVADNISKHTFSAGGTDFTVFCNKGAEAFLDKPYAATTGKITGLAAVNRNAGQLVPRDMADVAAFNPTAPVITALEPDALNWGSTEVDAKTITVKGADIDGKLSATLSGGADSKFTAQVSGTTVTVTPKGTNTTAADFAETLTVTAAGGNSMTATIKQFKPSTGPKWVKVTSAPADWSGDYLIVYEAGNVAFNGALPLAGIDAALNQIDVTIVNDEIASNAEVDASKFTIASVTGGYSIRSASGVYINRTASSNGMDESETTVGVNQIAMTDGTVAITSSGGPKLQYFSSGDNSRFRYYKSTQKSIALYKYTE